MWGKTTVRENTPIATERAPAAHFEERAPVFQAPKMASSVGKTMQIRGELYSDEELSMDGELEGTLDVRHRLTIGANGKVKARVKAKELVVSGKIEGNVEAAGRIVIMNGASILGDVKTAGIVIEDGAFFKGAIDIIHPETKQQETAPTVSAPVQSVGVGA